MIDNKETGLRIRAARESADLSVMKLARQVGVHRQTIYRIEDGSVEKISAALLNRMPTQHKCLFGVECRNLLQIVRRFSL